MEGKSVLITRPADQSKSFSEQLEKENFKVSYLPLIELAHIQNNEVLKNNLDTLDSFDWLVFTSVNAVKCFFETVEEFGVKLYFFPDLKIATVGEKTKLQLEQLGYRTNFVPIKYTAEVLADNMDDVNGKRILIPRSSKASNHYIDVFKSRGAQPVPVTVYENRAVNYEAREFSSILSKNFDYLTFASGSAIEAFHKHMKAAGRKLLEEKIICIGPSTATVAKDLGYAISAIAEPHTAEGIVEAIKKLERNVQTA